MWYELTAYNSQTLYGWTCNPAVAEAALARLNEGREVNLYGLVELGDTDAVTDRNGSRLVDRDDAIFDDDTRLDDFEPNDMTRQSSATDAC